MSGNDALAGSLGSEGVPYTRVAFLDPLTICVNIEGASSDMPGSVDTSQLTCASTGALGVHVCGVAARSFPSTSASTELPCLARAASRNASSPPTPPPVPPGWAPQP